MMRKIYGNVHTIQDTRHHLLMFLLSFEDVSPYIDRDNKAVSVFMLDVSHLLLIVDRP